MRTNLELFHNQEDFFKIVKVSNSMLIVNLIGGLGNQMFQYALGQSLEHKRQIPVKYDTIDLLDRTPRENLTHRDFELNVFKGAVPIASAREAALFRFQPVELLDRAYYRVLRQLKQPLIYEEKNWFEYDSGVLQTPHNTYFNGYWQTEQYWDNHAAVRAAFIFRHEPTGENLRLAEEIRAQPQAISVHIRRGDYISNPLFSQVHGVCSPSYYEQAVHYIMGRLPTVQLYIFSDEPEWVRQNMQFDAPAVYVAHNHDKNSFEDLRLMSLCKHHIIANSSFSWWGAWLNPNPDKIVIAPRQWTQFESGNGADLIPKNWIKM